MCVCVYFGDFRIPEHEEDEKGYQLISRKTDCHPSTDWLGPGTDLVVCAEKCQLHCAFVHATSGDSNCKCVTEIDWITEENIMTSLYKSEGILSYSTLQTTVKLASIYIIRFSPIYRPKQ